MLNLLAGIKMTLVPYNGAATALLDVIAGNVQVILTSPISAGGHMQAGRVRAVATTGAAVEQPDYAAAFAFERAAAPRFVRPLADGMELNGARTARACLAATSKSARAGP